MLNHRRISFSPMINNLIEEGAEKIFVITDLDEDVCITKTKERINAPEGIVVIVSVKQVEAWFLADSKTLSTLFKLNFHFEFPENENDSYNTLNNLFIHHTARGNGKKDNGGKIKTARKMLKNGFLVSHSSIHPNCQSAAYFIKKLQWTAQ